MRANYKIYRIDRAELVKRELKIPETSNTWPLIARHIISAIWEERERTQYLQKYDANRLNLTRRRRESAKSGVQLEVQADQTVEPARLEEVNNNTINEIEPREVYNGPASPPYQLPPFSHPVSLQQPAPIITNQAPIPQVTQAASSHPIHFYQPPAIPVEGAPMYNPQVHVGENISNYYPPFYQLYLATT